MQIKLTWRRVTLAAAVVVAGVAAPLAWATVGGKPASLTSSAAPARSASRSPVFLSPQAARSTGDNPFQLTGILTLGANQTDCLVPSWPAGVSFALDQVSAFPDFTFQGQTLQNAWLRVYVKDGPVFPDNSTTEVFLPLENNRYAVRSDGVDWVVKPNPFASAAIGDIYDIYFCVQNGPTAGSIALTFTGQRISNTATAASVRDFTARPRAHGALLSWTTGSESNLLGFNVWRFRNGKGVKVNRTLVEAKRSGEPTGASYTFLDSHPGARQGLTYRLQLVDPQGKRSWYAAFAIPA
jgi:hypothetical protein